MVCHRTSPTHDIAVAALSVGSSEADAATRCKALLHRSRCYRASPWAYALLGSTMVALSARLQYLQRIEEEIAARVPVE